MKSKLLLLVPFVCSGAMLFSAPDKSESVEIADLVLTAENHLGEHPLRLLATVVNHSDGSWSTTTENVSSNSDGSWSTTTENVSNNSDGSWSTTTENVSHTSDGSWFQTFGVRSLFGYSRRASALPQPALDPSFELQAEEQDAVKG